MIMHDNGVMRGVGRSDVGENAFKFTDIAGMVAWHEDDDAATITEAAGLVSQHDDKSGNSYHKTQGTASRQPETGVRTFNALNSFDWDVDGMNSTIDFSNTGQFDLTTGITGVLTVHSDATGSAAQPDYLLDQSVGSTGFALRTQDNTFDLFIYDTVSSLVHLNGVGTVSAGEQYILLFEISTTGILLYKNGVLISSDATALTAISNPSQTLVFGHEYSYSGKSLNGAMPFDLFYENKLTTAEKNSVFSELGDRYNITVGTL